MRRSTRRFTRGKREYVWTAITGTNLTVAAGTQANFPVVVMAADIAAGTGRYNATLLRIRGWVGAVPPSAATETQCALQAAAIVFDDDDATAVPLTSAASFTDEDILWQDGRTGLVIGSGAAGAKSFSTGMDMQIDIKAKRRLQTGKSVIIIVEAETTSLRVYGVMRALLQLS